MDVMGNVGTLLAHKVRQVWSVPPDIMVFQAIQFMAEKNVGAVVVVENDKLLGILTERDYTRKVILKGKLSRETPVAEIMTREPHTVTDSTSVSACMHLITEKRVRHLPVMEGDKVVAMVSVGDVMKYIMAAQSSTIDQLQSYITGGY